MTTPTMAKNRCRHCNLAIHQGRGGWRHTVSGKRGCRPIGSGRIATPRTQTPAPELPRAQGLTAGGVAARPPQGGTLAGPGGGTGAAGPVPPSAGPGGGREAAARPGIHEEMAWWETVKEFFPEYAVALLRWLELGDRVSLALRESW